MIICYWIERKCGNIKCCKILSRFSVYLLMVVSSLKLNVKLFLNCYFLLFLILICLKICEMNVFSCVLDKLIVYEFCFSRIFMF